MATQRSLSRLSTLKKSRKFRDRARRESRRLHLERLEDRRVMAAGPTLSAVFVNGSEVAINGSFKDVPRELKLRFNDGTGMDATSLANGIRVLRSGADDLFGQANDVVIQPGVVQLAPNPREVVIRFVDNLPDDLYRVELIGAGLTPLKNQAGEPFNGGTNQNFDFQLDLGPAVISIVPQPVRRNVLTGALTQARNEIEVYFNTDALNVTAAQNPTFYRLTDTLSGSLRLPVSAVYTPATNMVLLNFGSDLGDSTFHLQIGVSDENNDTLGGANNVGTITQRAVEKTYDSPVFLDANGNPITTPINDNSTAISRITVGDAFVVRDVNVQVDIDHSWGPDLRVFLVGPQGNQVELIRDLGVGVRAGQIYGRKFDDRNGDGVQGTGEPGLAGWTIYLDDNLNGLLDAGERSTVTDPNGDYAFINLALNQTYRVAEVGQAFWQQTAPFTGGNQVLTKADFSNGSTQVLRIIPDPVNGDPTQGTFTLGFAGRTTTPITFAGPNAATAANIQQALQAILDPGVAVAVQFTAANPIRFTMTFTRNGIGTPVDHDIIAVLNNSLNRGQLTVDTVGQTDGYTSTGPVNLWHLTTGRGSDPGHSAKDSFYFGQGETPTVPGTYPNNANGTLITPTIDLRDRNLTAPLFLEFNHRLNTELFFDFATVEVVNAAGQRTTIFDSDFSTGGFVAESFDISAFRGQEIHFEFTFTSDSSVTFEGWHVDDVRVTARPGVHNVTLTTAPLGAIVKNLDFGAFRGSVLGPDQFGYQAFAVTPGFEDITATGTRTLQAFLSNGFAIQQGGTSGDQANSIAKDSLGNLYVLGNFQGTTADFDPGAPTVTLTSAGVTDIFLAKYDANGAFQWVKQFGGTGTDSGNDVQVDSANRVLITGSFNGTVDFNPNAGTTNLISAGASDAFIAQLDSSGNLNWAQRIGSTSADVGEGVALDGANNVIFTGSFSGTVDLNPGGGTQNAISNGGTDVFVIKLNSAGTFVWARAIGGSGGDIGRAVVADAAGLVTVAGSFSGTVDFDPSAAPTAVDTRTSNGSTDGFVLRLTAAGNYTVGGWVNTFGAAAADFASAVALDSTLNAVVTGGLSADIILAKYSPTGAQIFQQQFGSGSTDQGEDIVVDALDRIYITGGFRNAFSLGGTNLTSAGGIDILIARFSPTGVAEYARGMGGLQDDTGFGIALDAANDIYHVGSFRVTSTFNTGPANIPLTSAGSTDAYLAKLAIVNGLNDASTLLSDLALGDFIFNFYGQTYQELFVSTNGLITFNAGNSSPNNSNLTVDPNDPTIAAFWEDLRTGSADSEAVFWEVRGTGTDERLIIQWNNVRLNSPAGAALGPLNFQAVLNERDNTIQFNYQQVTGPLLVNLEDDKRIGTFEKGQQSASSVAADSAGNYVVVYTSPGQDTAGNGVFARRYNAAGVAQGNEFQLNSIVAGDQQAPQIAMVNQVGPNDGRFVVVWQTGGAEVFARLFDAAGVPAGPEFVVNATTTGNQTAPAVLINNDGSFVVTWSGNGTPDADGIYARRFDATGAPLGLIDEIQRIKILGPPQLPGPDTFTLNFNGQITGNIAFSSINPLVTAANIETQLRLLPNLSNSVTVTAVQTNEVQTITFNPNPTGGNFTLVLGAVTTASIDFTANNTPALRRAAMEAAIQAASPTLSAVTVALGATPNSFVITYAGGVGNSDQPNVAIGTNNLTPTPPGVTLSVIETVKGIALSDQVYDVAFLGVDGGQDQPLLIHQARTNGVSHMLISELVKGNNGEFVVNSFLAAGSQITPKIARDPAGGFVVSWTSPTQDGDGNGVFAKRFNASGVAVPPPGDVDEIQEMDLLGTPAAGSTYQLGFGGQTTGTINFTRNNLADAAAIQTALRNLPNLGNTLTVRPAPGTSDEVQLISFSQGGGSTTTGGTFQLAHAGLFTGNITYVGGNAGQTATNIQDALRLLPGLGAVTVVPLAPNGEFNFLVTFTGGTVGGLDQPLMIVNTENLIPIPQASVSISDVNDGGHSLFSFIVEFNGVDGKTNQPSITLANNTGGVTAINVVAQPQGNNTEFLVPETTLGSQSQPAVAWQPSGNFVTAWTTPDGDANGVYVRLWDSTGSPLTPELQVNTFTQANQQQPTVLMNAAGEFTVVYSGDLQDGSQFGIFARKFSTDGTALNDEFQINELTVASQTQPAVALLDPLNPLSNFVVSWTSQAGNGGIHSRIFSAAGLPLTSEAQVSQFGTPSQDESVVARNSFGDYVVVWRENQKDPLIDQGIYAQAFFANGTPRTGEIQVHQTTDNNQSLPDVAIDEVGNFIVTWQSVIVPPLPATSHTDILARRFTAAGVPQGAEFIVNTVTVNNQGSPRIAIDAAGRFTIVWVSNLQDGDLNGIYARRFSALGVPLNAQEFRVNTTTAGTQLQPAIDARSSGEFLITWAGQDPNTFDVEVFAQRYDNSDPGAPVGGEFVVSAIPDGFSQQPDVAFDGAGRFVIAWRNTNNFIAARRFDVDSLPLTGNVVVSDSASSSGPRISGAADGRTTIVWFDGADVIAQRMTPDLQRIGNNLVINNFVNGTQRTPTVEMGDAGEFLVGWIDLGQGGSRVMVNAMGTDNPSVGIKAAGPQAPFTNNSLPIWVDGSVTPFVGPGLSTLVAEVTPARDRVFAANPNLVLNQLQELDPDTGAILRTFPMPAGASGNVSLAFVGNTLYFASAGSPNLFELDPADGAIVDQVSLASLGIAGSVSGLAHLDGELVILTAGTGALHFVDPFRDLRVRSLNTGFTGALAVAAGGSRGTLFVLSSATQIAEINSVTGGVLQTIAVPAAAQPAVGLAVVEGNLWVGGNAAGSVAVVDPGTNEVQTIRLSTTTTGGTFRLTFNAQTTAPIAFGGTVPSGPAATAANIQAALRALSSLGDTLTVTPVSPFEFRVTFTGIDGGIDQPLITLNSNSLLPAAPPQSVTIAETVPGAAGSLVTVLAAAGPIAALGCDDGGAIYKAATSIFQPLKDTILDDEAATSIIAGVGPYTDRFIPIEPLTGFDGQPVTGTWELRVQDTATGDTGVLNDWRLIINESAQTPPDYTTKGFLGDNLLTGANDIDLYRFNVLNPGTLRVNLRNSATLDGVIRVFNAAGSQIGIANVVGAGVEDVLALSLIAPGDYYIGVSSNANTAYSPVNGTNASGGLTTGEYDLDIRFNDPIAFNDNNSTFASSTVFGELGTAGLTFQSQIFGTRPLLNMPGDPTEPGHRAIPLAENHLGAGAGGGLDYAPGEMLLKFKPGTTPLQQSTLLANNGLALIKDLGGGALRLRSTSGDVLAKIRTLSSELSVLYAEPNYIVHSNRVPNDPSFSQLWGMNNIQQIGGRLDADIDATDAWDLNTGSSNVVIAVIDSGVDYTHPDLVGNMWRNPGEIANDGIDNDGNGFIDDIFGLDTANDDSDPFDDNEHGTHVSGTIGAVGDNGVGVAGVVWDVQIMGLKFLDSSGSGSTADAIDALNYITMMKLRGVNIVASNNSWGGGGFSQALQDAILASNNAGVLFVASAGNDGNDNDAFASYPATYPLPGIISVAATDPNDDLAAFGNFGSPFDSNFGATTVDLAAPGVAILSTTPNDTYSTFFGTSMAAPHVTGAVALLASLNPSATIAQIRNAILQGVDPIPALSGVVATGGRLNVAHAAQLLGSAVSTTPAIVNAFYNFQDFYGTLPSGDTPSNVITEAQKQRAREIFEIYGSFLGITFTETANQGLTVVTGDLRAVDPTVPTGPGGVAGIAGGGLVVMDAAENWGNSEYGGAWFQVAMHEIGHSLGLSHSYDLPGLTIMGDQNSVDPVRFPNAGEPIFPGDADLIHGQYLFPQGANDIDLFTFTLTEPGLVTAEAIAERLPNGSSLLDAALTLYRQTGTGGANREVVAQNDDYFSSDPRIQLNLAPGTYYLAVTSSGNEFFDPSITDSGFGGRSEGTYTLNVSFQGIPNSVLVDQTQTPLDGNADGSPGGQFDFWFQSGATLFVDKMADVGPGPSGIGTLAQPFDTLGAALDAAGSRIVIPATGAAAFSDGEQFTIVDLLDRTINFEFDFDGLTTVGAVAIPLLAGNSATAVALAVTAAINGVGAGNSTATATASGNIVRIINFKRLDRAGSAALMAAPNLVRVVGNTGVDGDATALLDNRPYLVGQNNLGQPLPDGVDVRVPQAATLMLDAGALFKLQKANIDAGSSAQGIDRSQGAIQVLGTPQTAVYFRSFRDDTAGGDTDGVSIGARPGDWGGVVFRADSDREQLGVFLNTVYRADMLAGGGKLVVDSVEQTFTPIHLIAARPNIAYNTIQQSADAAMSADPNSFDDSDDRIGPDIHDNHISNNSVNGLFVRIRTNLGSPVDRLDVPGRFDDTDIVHVLSENLIITGTPGGPQIDPTNGLRLPRLDARLRIDPGIIVKLDGARIETEIGAQLIAEGTENAPIIFTSAKDDTYGAGGTFDTTSDASASLPQAGQWGGLFFGHSAKGSLDHVLLTYAGGLTPIEGGFDRFNPVEIHQAYVRIANSTFQENDDGQSSSGRNGRGDNAPATIFVRGAQPIILDNVFRNNQGNVISISAIALDAELNPDIGRSTGPLDRFGQFDDNYGPLVRLNRLINNDTNGMEVRAGGLTSESVWDDTDIAHVVRGEILILNHHTFSGLRLLSSTNESLVVKLEGANAGFTANGVPLDIDDRIGGAIQILGMPGRPVILTSLQDDSVTAGFDTNGLPLGDTNNDGGAGGGPTLPTGPEVNNGTLIDNDVATATVGHFEFRPGPGGIALSSGVTVQGQAQVFINQDYIFDFINYVDVGASGSAIDLSTTTITTPPTLISDDLVISEGTFAGANGTINWRVETRIDDGTPVVNNTLILNSSSPFGALRFVNYLDEDVPPLTQNLLYQVGTPGQANFRLFTINDLERVGFAQGGVYIPGPGLVNATYDGFAADVFADLRTAIAGAGTTYSINGNIDLVDLPAFVDPVLGTVHGLGDVTTAMAWTVNPSATTATITAFLELVAQDPGTAGGNAGDWRSVRLERYSNDRNVSLERELEGTYVGLADSNNTPAKAQLISIPGDPPLNALAPNDKSGDADRRLGFEIHGTIAINNAADVDVYSFIGTAGSEVWFDIDQTSPGLDSIVELIAADGTVLARSLDNNTLSGLAQNMTKESWRGGDYFSANPRDAGMRVILPGPLGQTNTYYARVRSQTVLNDEANLTGGLSRGAYQLQIRLQQRDEVPGSRISYSDIAYATNGVEVLGMPGHSPLIGETGESSATNNTLGNAQPIGNLLTSDRNTISVAGNLTAATDLDWYQFTIDYDLIQAIGGFNGADKTWATIFDIDYADGLSRPDATISVFDENGNLILVSRDSNVEDDQSGAGGTSQTDDLSRGSFGTLDSYIGNVQMPTGVIPANTSRTYYVAVSSNAQLPEALNATFTSGALNPLIRLEPVNSVIRIAEDHIGFSGHTTGSPGNAAAVTPVQSLFDITDEFSLSTNVTAFSLADVVLFVSTPGRLFTADPFAGGVETDVGALRTGGNDGVLDIAMRTDGRMFGVDAQTNGVQNNAGQLVEINTAAGGATDVGDVGIPNFDPNTNPPDLNQLTTDTIDALAYLRTGFDGGANAPIYQLFYSVRGTRVAGGQTALGSTLYRADPASGNTPVANTPFQRIGGIFQTTAGDVGRTTGMAFVNGQLFGVSDTGNFFQIGGGGGPGFGLASNVINLGFSFAGLAPGPQQVEGGAYANLMFAIDTAGNLHAINTSGQLQPIFSGGATSVNTGVSGATGLAFSPLDFNLWHPTMSRSGDAGHGVNDAFDESRNTVWVTSVNGRATTEREGGASFRFGLETWVNNPAPSYFTYNGNAQLGVLPDNHRDLSSNPNIVNNYNLPGGALGSIVTNPFSLSGSVAQDKPTVYFNYFLDSENINSLTTMRDSFRVHISANGGSSWQELATNNSVLSNLVTIAELPAFISVSENASNHPNQRVQEAFDNSGGWRQARVDLSAFAGLSNLLIRFDFSTAGSMNEGLPGDFTGNFFHPRRGQNNQFEGVYIDDVIIGYAERGEMVTGSLSQNNYFAVPVNPDPSAPSQVLVGPYQLEMRRGTEYGVNTSGVTSDIAVVSQFDTNTRFIPSLLRLGDQNLTREQGHVEISSNTIRNAAGFGILVDAAARDTIGSVPHPGAVRNLPTLNNRRLVPSVSIENNVVYGLGTGGIRFSGETSPAGLPVAAVPYGEIVNNTVFGGVVAGGQGIVIDNNANPTVLNNIVANTATGISIDASSGLTEVGANLFRGNLANGVLGANPITLAANAPLFVDEANGNFYLFAGSLAIDSSLNKLDEDPSLTVVKSPLGIPTAPIFAPNLDRFGQLRIDDASAQPPPGLGSNIFKDRGAVERTDFARPIGRITDPLDNDPVNRDRDPAANDVLIRNETLNIFVLKLLDSGIGIDDLSVTPGKFTLTSDGTPLALNVDYTFVYNTTNDEVYFTPISGAWPLNHTYSILVDNSTTGVRDLAGNALSPNRTNGTALFTIFVGTVRDFGDAPSPYPSLNAANGAAHDVVLGYHLGAGVSEESDAQIATGDSFDDGVTNILFSPGNSSSFTVTASGVGFLDAWLDLNRDGNWSAGEKIVSALPLVAGSKSVVFDLPSATGLGQTTWARFRFTSAGINSPIGVAPDGEVEDYAVTLLGPPFHNSNIAEDVNNDGVVNITDLLVTINVFTYLSGQLGGVPSAPLPVTIPPYPAGTIILDPTGNGISGRGLFVDVVPFAGNFGQVNSLDLLAVLNWLTVNFAPGGEGEAEGEGGSAGTSFAMAAPSPTVSSSTSSNGGGSSTSDGSGASALLATSLYASPSIVIEERSAGSGSVLDDLSWLDSGSDDSLDLLASASPSSGAAIGTLLTLEEHSRRKIAMGPLDEDTWDNLLTDLSLDVGGLPGDLEDPS